MKNLNKDINNVLAAWNPIEVPKDVAFSEYARYVPMILEFIDDREKLLNHLKDILINKMGLDYDPNKKEHLLDLQKVCEKLIYVYSNKNR